MGALHDGIVRDRLAWLLLVAVIGCCPRATRADDFRVENRVYVGNEKEPASQSVTVFHQGAVYDYLQGFPEVIVLDEKAERFTLLDTARRLRTELTTNEVRMLSERLGHLAATSSDPLLQFVAHPKFEETFDAVSGNLTLESELVRYRLTTSAATSPAVAKQYREFSDWYAQLNMALNPGSLPPVARMMVNAALQRHERIPSEVHLTMTLKKGLVPKTLSVHSAHELGGGLSQSDLNRVAQTREYMGLFNSVSFEAYQKREK